MREKRIVVNILLIFFIIINSLLIYFFYQNFNVVTGNVATTGSISIYINFVGNVTIHNPTNSSYAFNVSDSIGTWNTYPLFFNDLTVSANFDVDTWLYSVYNYDLGLSVVNNLEFTPNMSFGSLRGTNNLTVSAKRGVTGEWTNATVVYYNNVSSSSPIITINSTIYACEGAQLSHSFKVTDLDGDLDTLDISPKNPFYVKQTSNIIPTEFQALLYSIVLKKSHVGVSNKTISAVDSLGDVDSKDITMHVLEINNLPTIENLGANTVWNKGEDSNFYEVWSVNDVEDGINSNNNLIFNISYSNGTVFNMFNIGSASGIMNFTTNLGTTLGVYDLMVCVKDNAIASPDANLAANCSGQTGALNMVCDNFSLTVTDSNRAPVITNYTPSTLPQSVTGGSSIAFYAAAEDDDGTIPDIDWYVDNVLVESNDGKSNDTYTYAPACGVSGLIPVKVVATDGLLNDSILWNVTVTELVCPVVPPSKGGGGGGGGGGGAWCFEEWAYDDWNVCQNTKASFDSGVLTIDEYYDYADKCKQSDYNEDICGFQIRNSHDAKYCNNTVYRIVPVRSQICYFIENPSCSDEIKNCHDNACELLVDCGGPCKMCSTCSDKIRNQGESGVDCGGPCPYACEPEIPMNVFTILIIALAILLLLVIIFIIYKLIKSYRDRRGENVVGDYEKVQAIKRLLKQGVKR